MLAKIHTFSLLGIDALPVEVEADISPGALPKTTLVGLPEAAVKESLHRVERAIVNSGFLRPQDRVVINLAPAELPKNAGSFDLPISLGMLAGSGQFQSELFDQFAVVGELSLEGNTRPVKGALSMAISLANRKKLRGIVLPTENASEAAVVEGLEVIPVSSLAQAVGFFAGQVDIQPAPSRVDELFQTFAKYDDDFADVRGQEMAKRAIVVAAAGSHNLLMVGPPGSGKTMLAKRVPTILPTLTAGESIETTRIYSAMGRLQPGQALMAIRPYRSPHHTISNAGLVGGGSVPVPGEISLAHNGILFLDELPEFNRQTLEVMRQPLEDKVVTISRALTSTTFPADFMLLAALNPCPCGYRNDPRRNCNCGTIQIERYMAKISGPLLDRIDMHIEVPAVPFKELSADRAGTSSADMRSQVVAARKAQAERFAGIRCRYNAQMGPRHLRQFCKLNEECQNTLRASVNELGLSARAHDKILRVARTIADLEGAPDIELPHIHEAINYRMLDRQMGKWVCRATTMFGIAAHPGSTEPTMVDLPEPRAPAAGEVLCRTLQVGVCGTDREILHSAAPVTPANASYLVLGHECLARVEAAGSAVTSLAVGDLVTPLVRRAFHPSHIRADMLAFGEFVERGIYLEHGFTPPQWLDRPEYLLKVPVTMHDVAILTEPLSVVEKAVNEALILQQARLSADAWTAEPPRVMVTGLGPIGFAGVLAAVARGWPVWVYGRDAEDTFRASLVRQLGGHYVCCADGEIEIADLEQHGYDLLLECTGSDEVMMSAAQAMRSRAILCWLGSERVPQARVHNVSRLMRDGLIRNQLVIGCVNSAPRDFKDALLHLALLRDRCGDALRQIITDRISPDESLWHYTHRRPQGIKVVLDYS